MNDDAFLDLFAFDLPDLAECAPDLAQAVDSCLAGSFDVAALTLARPIAGGAPDWWDTITDFFRGIWGGAGDLAEKIGRSFSSLWDNIWSRIGGTVRWLYNWGIGSIDWLGRQLYAYFTWVGNFINSSATWVGNRAWDAAYYVKDRVWDAATWVKDRVWDGVSSIGRNIQSGLEWAGGQVWGAATWTKDRVWDATDWLYQNTVPPIMGAAFSVGDVFAKGLSTLGDVLTDGFAAIGDKLVDAIRWPWEHIFEPFTDVVERKLAIPGKLLDGQYADLRDLIDDVIDPAPAIIAGIAGVIILGLIIAMVTTAITTILVAPLCEPHTQATQAKVGAALLTVGTVQEALNRGFIDEPTALDHLSRTGYDGQAKQALLELRNILPGPTDLIRMAVREVFNPEARRALDLDAEFPEPFAQYAALLGIEREWAENHWAAHWDLPSPSQGYEMLHRGLITEQGLADLLKALDYAPVWRDKLQAISYSPITRVDLRRLYKTSVITEADVFDGYKALGYNDERARWLTDFTLKYYSPEDESELDEYTKETASQIRLGYRRHVISRQEALDKLVELGYSDDSADFLLALDDVQLALNPTTDADVPVRDLTVSKITQAYRDKLWTRERAQEELETLGYLPWAADLLLQLEDLAEESDLRNLEETVVKDEYVKRAIDRSTASSRLDALGVEVERRDLLLRRWDLQAAQKTRELTVAQVQRGLRDGVFTETEALSRFAGMGYNDADSKFLVDDIDKTEEGIARRLSVSQLSQAYKLGRITDAQFLQGLLDLRYSQDDAQVIIDIATPATEAKERQLSAAQLSTGFRAGLITEAELLEKLTALGYAQADAELLRDIAARQPEPPARKLSVTNLKDLYAAGTIDRAQLLAELLSLGYSDRDAGWIRDLIAPEVE
ncbi:MAG: hypothetical protein WAV28_04800 [Sedimentisphaerales bacterium]